MRRLVFSSDSLLRRRRINRESRASESNPKWGNIEIPRLGWLKHLYICLDITRKIMLDWVLLCPDSSAIINDRSTRYEMKIHKFLNHSRVLKYQKGVLRFFIGMIHREEFENSRDIIKYLLLLTRHYTRDQQI